MNFFNNDAVFIFYLVGLSMIAYVKYSNSGYIKNIILSTLNINAAQTVFKSDISKKSMTDIFLSVNFYLSFSFFISFVLLRFYGINPKIPEFVLPAAVGIFVFLTIYINAGVNILSASLFKIKDAASEINTNSKLYYKTAGIIFLFANILISYTAIKDIVLYTGILAAGILYFLRILRLIKINLSKQINGFYMFLYLCTVEILPFLVLVKIFIKFYHTTN